jgi:glycosyltransferase involved in cell wall biosynthesis
VNRVWNYCGEVHNAARRHNKRWPSGFELINLTSGSSTLLGLHSDTVQAVCKQFAISRDACGKRPRWRGRKSLGWIPFQAPRAIRWQGDAVIFLGRRYRLWFSRPIEGKVLCGCFGEDTRGRWYLNLQVEAPEDRVVLGMTGTSTLLSISSSRAGTSASGRRKSPHFSEGKTLIAGFIPDIIPAMGLILFFDPVCDRPYDTETLRRQAMGGTEATVVRVADALGALVVQHNRTGASGRYLPPQRDSAVTTVIVNRDSGALAAVRTLYPNARIHLWLHDRVRPRSKRARRIAADVDVLRELAVNIICVSDTQRHAVEAALRWMDAGDRVSTCTIYNPVDDELQPDGTPVDDRKLVFLSSPNKGLKFTLDAFRAVRRAMPDLRLVVGNPGYKRGEAVRIDGVEFLGPQPQARIHSEVRTALCVFFPNFVIPETFGLVFAEAKALGTPVLTHDCGAALEVLGDPSQVLPVTAAQRLYEGLLGGCPARLRAVPARLAAGLGLFEEYVERIRAWRSGARPVTGPDPRFRLFAVAQRWREILKQ